MSRAKGWTHEYGSRGYSIAAAAIFLVTVVACFKSYVISHEMIYLLGSRRVADPAFLAVDFTWSKLPPTSFLFDHLVAPFWALFGEFAIVNIGRLVTWALTAWSLAAVGRASKLPPWSLVAGFAIWLSWGQTLADCGSPFEGFQVKSFAYPLVFFALAWAIRGRLALSGACAGLATAFHIIVGGWGCLALFLALFFQRRWFSLRRIGVFLLCAAPFILPLIAAVGLFHVGGISKDERQTMDGIYVTIAEPACCQLDEFMSLKRWVRAAVVFGLASVLVFAWPERESARLLGGFVLALVAFFLLGEVAQRLELYGFLKVLPCQLGMSLPALFLFVFVFAWLARGPAAWPFGVAGGLLVALVTGWLIYDRSVLHNALSLPTGFVEQLQRPRWGGPPDESEYGSLALYSCIRANTTRDSVFVTPLLKDFWPYAERAQVASRRHPPFDHRLIEWVERLEAINELDLEGDLTADESDLEADRLLEVRTRYGATHYLTARERTDLSARQVCSVDGYFVYDLNEIGRPSRMP